MPSEQSENLQWRHPHGMEVLKRLGIVERSNASISENDDDMDHALGFTKDIMLAGDDEAKNGGEFINDESDDNEFIFDRASLLQSHHSSSDDDRVSGWFNNRRTNMAESRRLSCCRGFLVALAFFIVASCFSIVGPTLGNLQSLTRTDSLSSAASVISANAFGAMIGIILCAGCNTFVNTFCIMMFALPLCAITTLVVPWCATLTSATIIMMLQGVSIGLVERGCYSVFNSYWRRQHSVLILFYIAFGFGATLSPLIASSFVVLNPRNISVTVPESHGPSKDAPPDFIRSVRSIEFEGVSDNSSTMGLLCNGTTYENCTTGFNTSSSSSLSTSSSTKPKKPPINEATKLDPYQTKTAQKEEAKAKQKQEEQSQQEATNSKSNLTNTSKEVATKDETTGNSTSTPSATTVKPSATIATRTPTLSTTPSAPAPTPTPATTTTTTIPTTVPTTINSTNDAGKALPVEWTFSGETWEKMKREFARMDNFQLAYVTVASIAAVLTVIFAVLCCFTPCRRQVSVEASSAGDYKFHLDGLWKSNTNVYAVLASVTFAFLVVGMEAILSSLLTIYAVVLDASHLYSSVVATSIFWLCVSIARIVSSCFYGRLSQTVPMSSCLGVALFSTGVVVVFDYWTVVWLVSAVLGICYGILYPLTYCWLDQQLSPAPWFSTIWCLASQLGRLIAPYGTALAMVHHSAKDFLFALLVTTLLICIIYVFMRSTVREAARLINVQQQRVTCKVHFGGGDAIFEYHNFNNAEAEDEDTYFDRSRDAKVANGSGTASLFQLNPKRIDRRH